jgi:hypothetical protein
MELKDFLVKNIKIPCVCRNSYGQVTSTTLMTPEEYHKLVGKVDFQGNWKPGINLAGIELDRDDRRYTVYDVQDTGDERTTLGYVFNPKMPFDWNSDAYQHEFQDIYFAFTAGKSYHEEFTSLSTCIAFLYWCKSGEVTDYPVNAVRLIR